MLIVSDVAGQFDALKRMTDRFLGKEHIYIVGDLIDRGPQSKEVVQYCMDHQDKITCLTGNHEHMFIDWYYSIMDADHQKIYESGIWLANGGVATLRSYNPDGVTQLLSARKIPVEHVKFLESRPSMVEVDNVIISHAAPIPDAGASMMDRLWNRTAPVAIPGKLQVFGHNSHWGLSKFFYEDTRKLYALCIDQTRNQLLTGFHVETERIIEEPYRIKRELEALH